MAKKQFKIRAKLVFSGEVVVQAHSRQEAESLASTCVAAMLGKVEVMSERVQGFEFPTHGETVINRKQEADNGTA